MADRKEKKSVFPVGTSGFQVGIPELPARPTLQDPTFAYRAIGSPFLRLAIQEGGSAETKQIIADLPSVMGDPLGENTQQAGGPAALPPALDMSQVPQPGQGASIGASFTPAPLRAPTVSTAPLREQRAKIGAAGKAGGLARAGALGEQKSAIREQAKAATDLANAQAKSVETVAGAIESRNARIADAQSMAIRREQAARQNVQDRMAEWRNARAERDVMKIDPDAWYRDKHGSTTGRRIGAAVSVAFGAIGQAFSGGPNTALRIIEGSINRNLASQRAKMLTADKSVAGTKEDVTSARQHFSDIAAINAAERAEIMSDAAAQIEALTLRAKTPEIQAKGQQLVAELRGKSADLEARAAETEFGAEMRTLTAQGSVLGQEMAIKSKNAQAVFDAKKATLAMQAKAAGGAGAGKPIPAGAVSEVKGLVAARRILVGLREQWNKEMKGNVGAARFLPGTWAADRWDNAHTVGASLLGKELEKRMTDDDFERYKSMLPSSGDWDEAAQAKFNDLEKALNAKFGGMVDTYRSQGFDIAELEKLGGEKSRGGRKL